MWVFSHYLFSILGFAFALLLAVRLLREKRAPGSTMAWLLAILLIPYIGVPLYLLLGGRKTKRLAGEKSALSLPDHDALPVPESEVERILYSCGIARAVSANRVQMLPTGELAYQHLIELVRSARHSISITTFILGRDDVGREIIKELSARAREGIKVRLLLDALGSLKTRGRFVSALRESGGEVGIFMPMLPFHRKWSANLRNHRKLVVVDGERALVGGMNLGEPYMGPSEKPNRWRDFAMRIEGPAVQQVASVFSQDWLFATGRKMETPALKTIEENSSASARLQIVPSGPDVDTDAFYRALVTALFQAKRRVWIVTPYFIPDEMLFQVLGLIAQLGREVRVIFPRRSNHLLADLARGSYVRELHRKGVRFFEYDKMIHSKILIVDEQMAIIGSANFDSRSLHLNYELSVFVSSAAQVRELNQITYELLSLAKPLTFESASLRSELKEWLEDASRLLAPLL